MKHRTASVTAVVAAIATAGLTVVSASWGAPAEASCSSSTCQWGYNYVGPSENSPVFTPTATFTYNTVYQSSGGDLYIGFGPSGSCYTIQGGGGTWSVTPSSLGCAGDATSAYTQYYSGATSYLKMVAQYY